ncbi:MAG TPA: GldG family protein, partial [Thermoanaerobaculia bacterium]|nr:GldG family protein [Thermoanaerobaculia bacterium]
MRESTAMRRQLLAGTSLGAGVLLVAALVLIVNYFGWKYWKRFDWTSGQLYSLSEKSSAVVADLDQDVEVIVFMTPASQLYVPVTELLSRYQAASSRISVRVLDPDRNPAEARRLLEENQMRSLNSVVLRSSEGERRVIEEADLAEYDYSGMQVGRGPQIREFLGEQLFTGAILELVEQRRPRILFTAGHGESAPDDVSPRGFSSAQDLLGRDNFEVETWHSLGQDRVPAGTDLVVVAGPQVGFLEPELETLTRYLLDGGRVLLLLDPIVSAAGLERTGFGPWLESYGVRLGEDIVVDPANPLPFYSAETFFAN